MIKDAFIEPLTAMHTAANILTEHDDVNEIEMLWEDDAYNARLVVSVRRDTAWQRGQALSADTEIAGNGVGEALPSIE